MLLGGEVRAPRHFACPCARTLAAVVAKFDWQRAVSNSAGMLTPTRPRMRRNCRRARVVYMQCSTGGTVVANLWAAPRRSRLPAGWHALVLRGLMFRGLLLASATILLATAAARAIAAGGGQLELTVVDRETGKPIACRMHLKGPNGRPRKIDKTLFWHDHFIVPGRVTLKLPPGKYTFVLERGPEYLVRDGYFTIENFADDTKQVDLGRFVDMAKHGWWSGDLYVRRSPRDIELLMSAEDLHLAEVETWWNDKSDWGSQPLPKQPLVTFNQNCCYHLMAGGCSRAGSELLLLNLPAPPKRWHGSNTQPLDVQTLREARDAPDTWLDLSRPFSWELPLLVASGQVDSIELAHSHVCRDTVVGNEADGKPRDRQLYAGYGGNALWTQQIYYNLLECGLRIPPTAGSGSGTAANPVGYNRVYVHLDGSFSYEKWWQQLRAGAVVVTNGPLMMPSVAGELPGHVFQAEAGQWCELEIGLTLSTRDPITYLEIVKNGQVAESVRFDQYVKTGTLPKLKFDRSGWFLVRAVTDVSGTYRFAMTAPYYVEIGYQRRISKQAVQFFLDWVYERARQLKQLGSPQAAAVLEEYRTARDFWQSLLSKANAD